MTEGFPEKKKVLNSDPYETFPYHILRGRAVFQARREHTPLAVKLRHSAGNYRMVNLTET